MTTKKIIDAAKAVTTTVENISKTTSKAIYNFAMDCKRDSDIVAADRAKLLQEQEHQKMLITYQGNYDRVANALGSCLVSNYKKCGVERPYQIEDVYCTDETMSINKDLNGNLIFRYEVDRICSDLYDGGMKKTPPRMIETTAIESVLRQALRRFARTRGYYFKDLDVIDIKGNRIRIEINGVRWEEIKI